MVNIDKNRQICKKEESKRLIYETNMLRNKYDTMLLSAHQIYRRIVDQVSVNTSVLKSMFSYDQSIMYRLKVFILHFSVSFIFDSLARDINSGKLLTASHNKQDTLSSSPLFSYKYVNYTVAQIKECMAEVLISTNMKEYYFEQILKNSCKALNDKYLKMPLKTFISSLTKFTINDNEIEDIYGIEDKKILIEIKNIYIALCERVFGIPMQYTFQMCDGNSDSGLVFTHINSNFTQNSVETSIDDEIMFSLREDLSRFLNLDAYFD